MKYLLRKINKVSPLLLLSLSLFQPDTNLCIFDCHGSQSTQPDILVFAYFSFLFIRHLYCDIMSYCDIYLCNIVIFCDILYCDILTYDEGEALQGSNRHLGFTKWINRGDDCKIMKSIL